MPQTMEGENYDIIPNPKIIIEFLIRLQARQAVLQETLIELLVDKSRLDSFVEKVNIRTNDELSKIIRNLYAEYGEKIDLSDLNP